MLVNCPSCQAHYNVPDAAIGPTGRQLRCAKCGQQWFIGGPEAQAEATSQPDTPSIVTPAPEAPPPPLPNPIPAETMAEPPQEAVPATAEPQPAEDDPTRAPDLALIAGRSRKPSLGKNPVLLAGIVGLLTLTVALGIWLSLPRLIGPGNQLADTPTKPELPTIPTQPPGLTLGDIRHTLSETPQGPILIVSGMATNTVSRTLPLPELRVQLLAQNNAELDNWPATFADTALTPGQSTRWQVAFPHPPFKQLAAYRAWFTASATASSPTQAPSNTLKTPAQPVDASTNHP